MTLVVKLEDPTPENSCQVKLSQGMFAIVDKPLTNQIAGRKWRAIKWHRKWYAYSTKTHAGTSVGIAMHRLIAQTPAGQVTHHLNRNSLDNRLSNLLNLTNREHREIHDIRIWHSGRNPRPATPRQTGRVTDTTQTKKRVSDLPQLLDG